MALLKRHAGTTPEEFREYYQHKHAPLALPWCLANGVTYYRQTHRPLRWASEVYRQKFEVEQGINLEEWDAVVQMDFPEGVNPADAVFNGKGRDYYSNIVAPDELKMLLSAPMEHFFPVGEWAVVGEYVELIVGGKAKIECGEWQKKFDELEGGVEGGK